MRAILVLYLNQFIGFTKGTFWVTWSLFCIKFAREVINIKTPYSKDISTEIYHAYVAVCYFTPLIGAVIADSYWGKFKTIFILSIVYVIGMFLMGP